MGQNLTVKLMNTVEDFYSLTDDYYDDGDMELSPETKAALQESMGWQEEHPRKVDMRSIGCYNDDYVKKPDISVTTAQQDSVLHSTELSSVMRPNLCTEH